MKRNLLTIAGPAVLAASLLVGCGAPRIVARNYSEGRSIVLVSQGYDTVGRMWEDQSQPAQSQTLTRKETFTQTYTGTIVDIDYADRQVTLQDAYGEKQTFAVSQDVRRFNEAKVGDKVALTYHLGFNAEVRKPTAEERQNPLVILQATGRTGQGLDPNAVTTEQVRALVTIEKLDRANQTLTVRGPRGRYYTARVNDPSHFDDVRVGDTIVMTFTEALAMSLTPVK